LKPRRKTGETCTKQDPASPEKGGKTNGLREKKMEREKRGEIMRS